MVLDFRASLEKLSDGIVANPEPVPRLVELLNEPSRIACECECDRLPVFVVVAAAAPVRCDLFIRVLRSLIPNESSKDSIESKPASSRQRRNCSLSISSCS